MCHWAGCGEAVGAVEELADVFCGLLKVISSSPDICSSRLTLESKLFRMCTVCNVTTNVFLSLSLACVSGVELSATLQDLRPATDYHVRSVVFDFEMRTPHYQNQNCFYSDAQSNRQLFVFHSPSS